MKIHRTLEEAKDDLIRVGDIIKYCEEAAECHERLALKCLKSTGKGESQTSALGGAAYFYQRAEMFQHIIPGIITGIVNLPLQTEEDNENDE